MACSPSSSPRCRGGWIQPIGECGDDGGDGIYPDRRSSSYAARVDRTMGMESIVVLQRVLFCHAPSQLCKGCAGLQSRRSFPAHVSNRIQTLSTIHHRHHLRWRRHRQPASCPRRRRRCPARAARRRVFIGTCATKAETKRAMRTLDDAPTSTSVSTLGIFGPMELGETCATSATFAWLNPRYRPALTPAFFIASANSA